MKARWGKGVLVVAPVALLLFGASQAQAAQRFADPAGTGTTCSSALPCDLNEAVGNAAATDEVIVNPGTYNQGSTPLLVTGEKDVHGAAGQPSPQLNFTTPGFSGAIQVSGTARVAHLRIDVNTSGTALVLGGGTLGQGIYARTADATGAVGCSVSGAVIRDSVCWAPNGFGEGMLAAGASLDSVVTVRNVTAIGSDRGMEAFAGVNDQVLQVDVKNSIFNGPDEDDIEVFPLQTGSDVDVVLTNSNYDTASVVDAPAGVGFVTPVGSPTNQTAAPLFVNAPLGDFRQAAGSPTLDGGVSNTLGPSDFEGDPRSLDATPACSGINTPLPDIGADELVAPMPNCATTPPAATGPTANNCKAKSAAAAKKKKKKKKKGCGKKKKKKRKKR